MRAHHEKFVLIASPNGDVLALESTLPFKKAEEWDIGFYRLPVMFFAIVGVFSYQMCMKDSRERSDFEKVRILFFFFRCESLWNPLLLTAVPASGSATSRNRCTSVMV